MEVDPNNEDLAALYREIGSAYFEQGNIENAIPMLQEALHLMEAIAPMKETEADLLSVRVETSFPQQMAGQKSNTT